MITMYKKSKKRELFEVSLGCITGFQCQGEVVEVVLIVERVVVDEGVDGEDGGEGEGALLVDGDLLDDGGDALHFLEVDEAVLVGGTALVDVEELLEEGAEVGDGGGQDLLELGAVLAVLVGGGGEVVEAVELG